MYSLANIHSVETAFSLGRVAGAARGLEIPHVFISRNQ